MEIKKICKGCGSILQTNNKDKEGYCLNDNQDFCQRCFRLTNYNDFKYIKPTSSIKNIKEEIININKPLLVYVIDCVEALFFNNDLVFNSFNDDIVILINKIDIFPKDYGSDRLIKVYKDIFIEYKKKYPNIIDIFMTSKKDYYFKDMFTSYLKELDYKNIVFIGRTNAGKSSIINLLTDNKFTVSSYANTTLHTNYVEHDGYKFYDTPGLIEEDKLDNIDYNNDLGVYTNKRLKPMTFQIFNNQTYFIDMLTRIDIKPIGKCSVTFFLDDEYNIHRTSTKNAGSFFDNHHNEFKHQLLPFNTIKEFKCNDYLCIGIENYGFFTINKKANVKISINDKINVYTRKKKI